MEGPARLRPPAGPSALPRRLHQVWFGPHDPPWAWLETWALAHPDWHYRLWREADVEALRLANGKLWLDLIERGIWDAASDVARIEILHRLGGVYADADSRCLRPLDGAPFLGAEFFATAEVQPSGRRFVTNAFMGCVPGSGIAGRYVQRIARSRLRCRHGGDGEAFCCAWRITGPLALTEVLRGSQGLVLEPWAFFTQTITGEPIPGEGWAEHFWASTTSRSPAGTFKGKGYEEAV